ncbi:MAG: hydrogenase maturation protease [Desulfurococcaceae archaeon]
MSDFCSIFHQPFLIVGTGSPLRQDDQAGLIACDELNKNNIFCLKCEYGIENCFDEILKHRPKVLIVIDAVLYSNGKPGEIVVVGENALNTISMAISTHYIPFKLTIDMLKNAGSISEVYVIGIYPRTLDIGFELSSEVALAISELTRQIKQCIMRTEEKA